MSAPTSPWLPTRSPAACPVCGAAFLRPAAGPCGGCGIDLRNPAVGRIFELDRQMRQLSAEREVLLASLVATRAMVPTAPPPAPTSLATTPPTALPPAPTAGAAPPPPPPEASGPPRPIWERARISAWQPVAEPTSEAAPTVPPWPPRRRLGVPTLLALAGVALLTTAAVVFTAVTWTTLPSGAQAAILLAATVVAALAALALERREIVTAAAALGVLTMTFAAVDVIGLERTGLVDLGEFGLAIAAAVAAVAGWTLARAGLRWVSTAGALAAIASGVGVTVGIEATYAVSLAAVAWVGLGAAVAVYTTAFVWRTEPARAVVALGSILGITASGLLAASGLGEGEIGLGAGLGVLAVASGLLVAGSRSSELTLAPAALLATAATAAVAADLGAVDLEVVAAAGVGLAVLVWTATRLEPGRRDAIAIGCVPAAVAVAATSLTALDPMATRLVATIARDTAEAVDPWAAVTVALVGITVLSLRRVRRSFEWVVVGVAAIVGGALDVGVTWPLLLAVGLLAVAARLWPAPPGSTRLVARTIARTARIEPMAVLALVVLAIGWAAGTDWTLGAAAATAAFVAIVLAVGTEAWRAQLAGGLALASTALAVAATAVASGVALDLALGAGLAVPFVGAVIVPSLREERPPVVGTVVGGLASIVVPAAATTLRASGMLLLVAAAGWLALVVAGWRHARWVGAAITSAGVVALLADAGVDVVEAYSVVPALTLGAAGVWWLAEDERVRTVQALTPALVVGLVPSLVVLSGDPQALARTLGLIVVAGALAFVGVRARWLAPAVAGSVTAGWVALTQLAIAIDVAPRWATFAAVGALLVWLAATYERQQQRARSLASRVADYR